MGRWRNFKRQSKRHNNSGRPSDIALANYHHPSFPHPEKKQTCRIWGDIWACILWAEKPARQSGQNVGLMLDTLGITS